MKLSKRGIQETAYHEAAHAVMAALLNMHFIDILIPKRLQRDENGYMAGRLRLRTPGAVSLGDVAEMTLMTMAGPAASKRLMHALWADVLNGDGIGDFKIAVRYLDLVTGRYWTYQYLKLVRARAVKAVEMHWGLITKVGDALIERGRLTRAEVLRLIGGKRDAEYLPVSIFTIPERAIFFLNSRVQCPNLPNPDPWHLDQSRALVRWALPKITGLTMEHLESGDPLERKRERRNGRRHV